MPTEIKTEITGQPETKLLRNLSEAASQLNLAPITVRRLVARKLLHRQPHVRKLMFTPAELQRFANQ
jgi:hypothetical protein